MIYVDNTILHDLRRIIVRESRSESRTIKHHDLNFSMRSLRSLSRRVKIQISVFCYIKMEQGRLWLRYFAVETPLLGKARLPRRAVSTAAEVRERRASGS